MLTAQEAKDITDETKGYKNLADLMRQIRQRAHNGYYTYTLALKLFSEYSCSPKELEKHGYKTEIYFDKLHMEQLIKISWD